MKSDRKANLLVFRTIAIVALGLSSISAALTGDLFTTSLPGMNSSDKMIALDDDGFSPNAVSTYKEEVEVEDKNETNETVDDSDSNITNEDSDNSETEEKTPKPEESTTPTTHTDTSENSAHSESNAGSDEE